MVSHALIESKEFARAEALLKDALQHRDHKFKIISLSRFFQPPSFFPTNHMFTFRASSTAGEASPAKMGVHEKW